MAHLHKVYDNDTHFKINPNTRTFLNESEVKNTIAQGDHNSERITFEIQRLVDGHDMSLCNRIEIHYLNVDTTTKETSEDVYISDDVMVSPEDENIVEFSWLISENATKYNGILSFAISMKCLTGDVVDYKWNTLTYEKLSVGKSLNNVAAIQETVSDIIAKWKQELVSSGAIDLSNLVTKEEFNELKESIEDLNVSGVTDEQIENAVNNYLTENPINVEIPSEYVTETELNEKGYLTEHQDISGKQDKLVSGTNIKTVNGQSLLGSGNITIEGGSSETIVLDESMSDTSTNGVQNKVIKAYVDTAINGAWLGVYTNE